MNTPLGQYIGWEERKFPRKEPCAFCGSLLHLYEWPTQGRFCSCSCEYRYDRFRRRYRRPQPACRVCGSALASGSRRGAKFCSNRCRQAAYRARVTDERGTKPEPRLAVTLDEAINPPSPPVSTLTVPPNPRPDHDTNNEAA